MPITVEVLEALFPADDKGNQRSFEFDHEIGKFSGTVVLSEFRGLSVPTRQERVWDRLKEKFGAEAAEISLVLTYSPEEWSEVGDSHLRAAG